MTDMFTYTKDKVVSNQGPHEQIYLEQHILLLYMSNQPATNQINSLI
jgi:hypothetical protein